MHNGKILGNDGLFKKFYVCFYSELGGRGIYNFTETGNNNLDKEEIQR